MACFCSNGSSGQDDDPSCLKNAESKGEEVRRRQTSAPYKQVRGMTEHCLALLGSSLELQYIRPVTAQRA